MNEFCPDCGSALNEVRNLTRLWIRPLKCPQCRTPGFLEVADMKWIYPLLRLEYGVLDRLVACAEGDIEEAVKEIQRIDFKTVSIVDFEKYLMKTNT